MRQTKTLTQWQHSAKPQLPPQHPTNESNKAATASATIGEADQRSHNLHPTSQTKPLPQRQPLAKLANGAVTAATTSDKSNKATTASANFGEADEQSHNCSHYHQQSHHLQ
mmetsp:Transcript_26100/g.42717  ORF Transcript_26100/g.42717 Transcript_26100/m.42717 type:complete len:111 (+) Transcript_26100:44-376(+)